jgi:signal transduction histidine kinase
VVIAAVAALGLLAVSTDEPVTYMVFPALIWAALRFGPQGATLAIAIAAGVAIGVTANDLGPFFKQPIDHRTLSTQAYIAVAALTTLFLSAVVGEREASAAELAEARRHEGELAVEERHRMARELHDSVSQSLFSSGLHTRTAQKALDEERVSFSSPLRRALSAIAELTRDAQSEMRALVFELRSDTLEDGLVVALDKHASRLASRDGLPIDVRGPERRLALSRRAESELFGIGREALSNVLKHADATIAQVRIERRARRVLVEIRDDGRGFDPAASHPDHYGIESMRSRAAEIGGLLTITSVPGHGTVVRVEAPADAEGAADGA